MRGTRRNVLLIAVVLIAIMNLKEKNTSQMLQDMFTKTTLLSFLREELKIKLPRSTQFQDVVNLIAERNLEQDFCRAISKELKFDAKIDSFAKAYGFYKVAICLDFFNVEQLIQMAEDLSGRRTKWTYKRKRGQLLQSIMNNAAIGDIEEYIQRQIREKQIPPIQQSKFGWILGPMGVLKSTVTRKPIKSEGMIKFLLNHCFYPSPYNELMDVLNDKLAECSFDKHDPLLKEKFSQVLLAKLSDEEIFATLNQLIENGSLKIDSIERYWDFVATPHGIFETSYHGDENLAHWILRMFAEEELAPFFLGGKTDNIEHLVQEKCITETPDKILAQFFGSGPSLAKLASRLGLFGLHKIENEKVLSQVILLKLGFDVPPELEGTFTLASKVEKYRKDLDSGSILNPAKWNEVFNSLERILEDLVLFYGGILQKQKLVAVKEEERAAEVKEWIRKTFKLEKQFNALTFGDLCALLRSMNRFSKDHKNVGKQMNRLFGRTYFLKDEHLDVLDFVKQCRTELTQIHWTQKKKQCDQPEVLARLTALLGDLNSQTGRLRTYPYLIRLKEEVTNEFGVRYYTVVNEENRSWNLKTREWIEPEDIYFMISDSLPFAIDPVLLKKFW